MRMWQTIKERHFYSLKVTTAHFFVPIIGGAIGALVATFSSPNINVASATKIAKDFLQDQNCTIVESFNGDNWFCGTNTESLLKQANAIYHEKRNALEEEEVESFEKIGWYAFYGCLVGLFASAALFETWFEARKRIQQRRSLLPVSAANPNVNETTPLFSPNLPQHTAYIDFLTSLTLDKKLEYAGLKDLKIPEDYICPLSCVVMTDPVKTSCGKIYERSYISQYIAQHAEKNDRNDLLDPVMKVKIDGSLTECVELKNEIHTFVSKAIENHPQYIEDTNCKMQILFAKRYTLDPSELARELTAPSTSMCINSTA